MFDSCFEVWDDILDLTISGTSLHLKVDGIWNKLLASWQTSDGKKLIDLGVWLDIRGDNDVDDFGGTEGRFIPQMIWSILMLNFVANFVALSNNMKLLLRNAVAIHDLIIQLTPKCWSLQRVTKFSEIVTSPGSTPLYRFSLLWIFWGYACRSWGGLLPCRDMRGRHSMPFLVQFSHGCPPQHFAFARWQYTQETIESCLVVWSRYYSPCTYDRTIGRRDDEAPLSHPAHSSYWMLSACDRIQQPAAEGAYFFCRGYPILDVWGTIMVSRCLSNKSEDALIIAVQCWFTLFIFICCCLVLVVSTS